MSQMPGVLPTHLETKGVWVVSLQQTSGGLGSGWQARRGGEDRAPPRGSGSEPAAASFSQRTIVDSSLS